MVTIVKWMNHELMSYNVYQFNTPGGKWLPDFKCWQSWEISRNRPEFEFTLFERGDSCWELILKSCACLWQLPRNLKVKSLLVQYIDKNCLHYKKPFKIFSLLKLSQNNKLLPFLITLFLSNKIECKCRLTCHSLTFAFIILMYHKHILIDSSICRHDSEHV